MILISNPYGLNTVKKKKQTHHWQHNGTQSGEREDAWEGEEETHGGSMDWKPHEEEERLVEEEKRWAKEMGAQ